MRTEVSPTRLVELSDKGSHFYRSDFQVHTPRDRSWKGAKATSASEREDFARRFVAACRSKGLQAVAITDHHDLLFAPIIRKAASEEVDLHGDLIQAEERLVVFPGVELTLGLGRQALLILDANLEDDKLEQVLHALAITVTPGDQSTLPEVQALDHIQSFSELHKKLDEHSWLSGRYIVLPNVSDGGHKTISARECRLSTSRCHVSVDIWMVRLRRSEAATSEFSLGTTQHGETRSSR